MDAVIIEEQALRLPDRERAILADRLLESLHDISAPVRANWIEEADSRMSAYRSGEIISIDGSEAIAQLRSKF
ncbi:MAG: addiction module protein [Akkermansiaceae bacterium]|nr:addiction module protein [Akkermansiaceae bacterium]